MNAPVQPSPDDQSGEVARRPLLPLYGAAFLAAMAGSEAVAMTSSAPQAGRLATFLALAGCLTSVGILRRARSSLLGALLIALALVFAGLRSAQLQPGALFYPVDVAADPDLLLAMTFAWINAGYCFVLTRPGRFCFTIVPTLAIFGLVAPMNLSTEMVVDFLIYLFASIFLLGYEGTLERDLKAGRPPTSARLDVAYSRLAAAALVFVVVAGTSALAAPWLARFSPQLFGAVVRQSARMFSSFGMLDYSNLSRSGFYIGKGPIRLDSGPVMKVRAPRGGLWRGMAYDRYTGSGWHQTGVRPTGVLVSDRRQDLRRLRARLDAGLSGPRQTVRQVFELQTTAGTTGFALAEPSAVRQSFASPGTSRVMVDAYGCMSFSSLLTPGAKYEVWSEVPAGDPEDLRQATVPSPEQIGSNYFDLPLRTRGVAEDIVKRVTQGATTPFEKAEAIRQYVSSNHEYTLDGPFVPMQSDAVVDFLTYQRRGACDLFASAFVVLARAAGLPARVATGYAEGEYLPDEQAFLVRGTDAHAWAEVYFDGHGWITFDPTVGATSEAPGLISLLGIGQYWRFAAVVLRRALVAIVGVALVLLAVTSLLDLRALGRWVRAWWRRRRRGRAGELESAYLSACRQVRRAGWRRADWQTPGEFARLIERRAGPRARLAAAPLRLATEALQRAKYGGKQVGRQELDAVRRSVRRMRHYVRYLPRPEA